MRVKTLKPHHYLNKDRKPGDEYEADEKFGRALVDAGIARRMPYADREMLPEGARVSTEYRAADAMHGGELRAPAATRVKGWFPDQSAPATIRKRDKH